MATLFSIFGVVAFILSAVGLYGVMSFSVNQRTQEFGIRMALGADAKRIFRMVMTQGAWQLAIGLVLGAGGIALLLGVLAAAALKNILFKVNALDPSIYLAVAGLLTLVAALPVSFPLAALHGSIQSKPCALNDMNDLRFAFRQLRKAPAFTLTALATIAICLGANLAIFAVINSILLRPLPFPDADRLVTIYNTYPKAGVQNDGSSVTNYYERRGNIPAFSSLSIFLNRAEPVGEPGSTEQEEIMRVSAEFFTTLGVGLAMGRPFAEADMADDSGVVILTDGFWRQRLNSDPNVLGRDLRVNGIPRKIVGVLPPDFRFLSSEARLYLPYKTGSQRSRPRAIPAVAARI